MGGGLTSFVGVPIGDPYTAASDVFAFGVVVWEMLTIGAIPFSEVTLPIPATARSEIRFICFRPSSLPLASFFFSLVALLAVSFFLLFFVTFSSIRKTFWSLLVA